MSSRKNDGFTLIEMAVVLLIISLVVAAIIRGQSMIRQANIRSIISDFEELQTVTRTFKDKYTRFPGDLEGASVYWPENSVYQGFRTENGNGNGKVEDDISREDLRAWQHVTASKMLAGKYTGELDGTKITIGKNIPDSDVSGGGFWFVYTSDIYGNSNNAIHMASEKEDSLTGGVMDTSEAVSIDTKLDDGNPDKGNLVAINDEDIISKCVIEERDSNTEYRYNKSNTERSCRLLLWIYQ